jgi:hypothetical protein
MEIVDNKQTWNGFFTYQDGYESIYQYINVPFVMQLVFNGNSFVGTSTDAESENVFNQPATVKGFIEEDKISFVMKYPCYYYKDESGTILLDKDVQHPNIEYLGFYDSNERKFSGTWEMIIYEEKISEDQFLEEVLNGEFEIKRIL